MKQEAGSLHCPNCGAAVAPDAGRCPYCKARLATVSCPSCFALMFDAAAYCPACGAKRSRVETGATGTRCPACRVGMARVAVGATALLECPTCDGVWVEADDFERVCAENDAQAAVLHRFDARRPPGPGRAQRVEEVRYRPCVRCGRMMNRMNFGGVSGTIVDVCRGHGTFLDAGELHAIVTFVRGGGLDRARQRKIDELKEEERRLKELEARRVAAGESGWTIESRSWSSGGLLDLFSLLRRDS
jgi:Zn-finger nucleic acid-binding protein